MVSHRPRKHIKTTAVKPVEKTSPAWIILRPINASTMVKNPTSALAARRDSPKRRVSIVISRRTRSELPSLPLPVTRVTKHFTTTHLTTLIFAPRIQLHSPLSLIENNPPVKPQIHLLVKKPRRLLRLARVQPLQQTLKCQPHQVPVGKWTLFLSLRTLFLPWRKASQTRTDNIGPEIRTRLSR